MRRLLSHVFLLVLTITVAGTADERIAEGASNANIPSIDLIDAHGVKPTAIILKAEDEERIINLDLTSTARELLLEHGSPRPDYHEHFSLLGDADKQAVIDAVGQCYRWFDHLFNNAAYPQERLRLSRLTTRYNRPFPWPGKVKWYHGECTDGYWLNFRKREDSWWWWFDAGREFKGKAATVKVRLHFSSSRDDFGEVLVDGKRLFHCKPGADTYEGAFARRFDRSRLWLDIDTESF